MPADSCRLGPASLRWKAKGQPFSSSIFMASARAFGAFDAWDYCYLSITCRFLFIGMAKRCEHSMWLMRGHKYSHYININKFWVYLYAISIKAPEFCGCPQNCYEGLRMPNDWMLKCRESWDFRLSISSGSALTVCGLRALCVFACDAALCTIDWVWMAGTCHIYVM